MMPPSSNEELVRVRPGLAGAGVCAARPEPRTNNKAALLRNHFISAPQEGI
jgi:hypothetical protein